MPRQYPAHLALGDGACASANEAVKLALLIVKFSRCCRYPGSQREGDRPEIRFVAVKSE